MIILQRLSRKSVDAIILIHCIVMRMVELWAQKELGHIIQTVQENGTGSTERCLSSLLFGDRCDVKS